MDVDFTGINPVKFIKEVYNLSIPQGLGFLHFEAGGLTTKEAKELLKSWEKDKMIYLGMDYVKGRACKMIVFRKEDKLFFRVPWYDHTDVQTEKLLKAVWPKGKSLPEISGKHGISCNCEKCQAERR